MAGGAAFFDMDKTLLGVNSAKLWALYQWRRGRMGSWDLGRSMWWLARYKLSLVDIEHVSRQAVGQLEGQAEASMREEIERWYHEEVRQHLLDPVVARVKAHRQQGEPVVLLTASSVYLSELVAAEVGLDDVLCTRFEVVDGRFTGRIAGELCYGAGKVVMAREWLKRRELSLQASSFYSDSLTDLPMLEVVGRPVVVNPDPRLARLASRRGWPQIKVA
jgi:HAD superfamily hydrolase (TIGR01490 family)